MKLYSYWRSSASWRVRIALHLKKLEYETVTVSLIADGGRQNSDDYSAINPQNLVPALVLADGTKFTQSLAIIDWLESTYPDPALLPHDTISRAHVLAAALAIAVDIQPINNLRVVKMLSAQFGADADAKAAWSKHWIEIGFNAFNELISPGPFAFGNRPTLADICLIPQLYNARRVGLDLEPWPRLLAIEAACKALPAFSAAAPEAQPDAI